MCPVAGAPAEDEIKYNGKWTRGAGPCSAYNTGGKHGKRVLTAGLEVRPWSRGVLRERGQRRASSFAGAMSHVRVAGAAQQQQPSREEHEHGGCLRA